ncbi:Uma2 family endonuclease [Candidatus Cyanaurora vandensis]|uniref:Uma2 family endonuclease n=1 Tax=Candidatus Cyanaurora vandensis TaxID=2714958 RepID=UPI00257CA3BF|nr:Uma2 family endonuclease [Candidatus Cyanaurora vandensis]
MQSLVVHPVLPLENGDHLSRAEFEQRYEAMPLVKKAELIEGIVYMPSPVRIDQHGRPHALLMGWLSAYWAATPGTDLADNTTIRLDEDNEPQPDALLRFEQGTSRVDQDGYVVGPPEFVAEISSSTASLDMNAKKQVYRRNGVQEYLVWLVQERVIHWFQLAGGEYRSLPNDQGVICSQIFPGLRLAVPELLAGDLKSVVRVLQE